MTVENRPPRRLGSVTRHLWPSGGGVGCYDWRNGGTSSAAAPRVSRSRASPARSASAANSRLAAHSAPHRDRSRGQSAAALVGPRTGQDSPRRRSKPARGPCRDADVIRLGLPPTFMRTMRSTNPIESMLSTCRRCAPPSKAKSLPTAPAKSAITRTSPEAGCHQKFYEAREIVLYLGHGSQASRPRPFCAQ